MVYAMPGALHHNALAPAEHAITISISLDLGANEQCQSRVEYACYENMPCCDPWSAISMLLGQKSVTRLKAPQV